MNATANRLIILIFRVVAAVAILLSNIAYAQPYVQLRDIPRTAELENFKQQLEKQSRPIDAVSLYNEIQRLQGTLKQLGELRTQRSMIDSQKDSLKADMDSQKSAIKDPTFCRKDSTAEDVKRWWVLDILAKYNSTLQYSADRAGVEMEPLKNTLREPKPSESCRTYAAELPAAIDTVEKVVLEDFRQYQQVEQERIANIPEVDKAYKAQIERLTQDLEKARQHQGDTANKLANDLWAIILVLGGIALGILLLVRWFPSGSRLELVQSGQVIQFITVLLLLTVIMSLGLSGKIQENTLGTLLGGLAGYVLSQGVGRTAQHIARKAQSGETHP